jgi:hypothetical protein
MPLRIKFGSIRIDRTVIHSPVLVEFDYFALWDRVAVMESERLERYTMDDC